MENIGKEIGGATEQEKSKSVFLLSWSCWLITYFKMKKLGREEETGNETEGRKISRRCVRKMNY